jgi:cation diffusion facilitator family transporter
MTGSAGCGGYHQPVAEPTTSDATSDPTPDQTPGARTGATSVSSERSEGSGGPEDSSSLLTVVVALAANGLLAVAKTVAAVLTGSASMVAEAAHSWSDTGNEIFLLMAERRGSRPRDEAHPRGYGRATYIWSLVAAFGLFSAGAVVSVWHGVTELFAEPGPGSYVANYVVLGLAFVFEGISFLQAARQLRGKANRFGFRPLRYVERTSDPTLRAVVLEDSAALVGLVLAGGGIGLHQLTGRHEFDAAGSIAVGVLLACVAVFLMRRNMDYLLGGEGDSADLRKGVLGAILEHPDVERVTYLHLEYVGPQRLFVVAAVDLTGDDREADLAVRLRRVEADIELDELIEDAVLTLSLPEDASLTT